MGFIYLFTLLHKTLMTIADQLKGKVFNAIWQQDKMVQLFLSIRKGGGFLLGDRNGKQMNLRAV